MNVFFFSFLALWKIGLPPFSPVVKTKEGVVTHFFLPPPSGPTPLEVSRNLDVRPFFFFFFFPLADYIIKRERFPFFPLSVAPATGRTSSSLFLFFFFPRRRKRLGYPTFFPSPLPSSLPPSEKIFFFLSLRGYGVVPFSFSVYVHTSLAVLLWRILHMTTRQPRLFLFFFLSPSLGFPEAFSFFFFCRSYMVTRPAFSPFFHPPEHLSQSEERINFHSFLFPSPKGDRSTHRGKKSPFPPFFFLPPFLPSSNRKGTPFLFFLQNQNKRDFSVIYDRPFPPFFPPFRFPSLVR